MKKLIAVLLSAAMVFGCMSLVLAADPEVGVPAICTCAGDINYDGNVNSADARLALRRAVDLETDESLNALGEKAAVRANVDGKEDITSADARQILRFAVELDPLPPHKGETETTEATWTAAGKTETKCAYCGEAIAEPVITESKADALIDDANAWAAEKGLDNLIKGESENEGKNIALVIDVDAIWEGIDAKEGAFDGFLTQLGAFVSEKLGDAEIKLDGNTVYNGKLLNTPVKNAIFNVFAGFFYKIATAKDGVYGVYTLTVDGEDIELTVKMTGSEANVAKVQNFAQVIADHISADTSGTDLIVTVTMPDALMSTVNAKGGIDKVNASTLGTCLSALKALDLNSVIGSQVSAVNKLCATVCGQSAFVNKVVGKVTAATVTVEGKEVALLADGAAFAPASNDYAGLLDAAIDMLSEEIMGVTIGSFAQEDGSYKVPVTVTVDVGNAALFTNGQITETVIFVFVP